MRMLSIDCRRRTAQSLISGNDTCCFTTQQYLDAYVLDINKGMPCLMDLPLARHHLESIPELVAEVRPDVWAGAQSEPVQGVGTTINKVEPDYG
jgi:hypothetical protein